MASTAPVPHPPSAAPPTGGAPWRRRGLIIAVLYAVVMAGWVTLSDELITGSVHDPGLAHQLVIEKDLLFVAFTAVMLYLAIRVLLDRLHLESRRRLESEQVLNSILRRLVDRLARIREEEQARFARDLHDDIGQLLTALTLTLRSAERLAADLPPEPAPTTLRELQAMATGLAGELLASTRRIAADLRPPALDNLDVAAALGQELRRLEDRTGLRGELHVQPGFPTLPAGVATALYRIGQEALTNVARHAKAGRVDVAVRLERGAAVVEVSDDGVGPGTPPRESLGIVGMRERAWALGGELTFRPGATSGTVVAARIPISPPAEGVPA